ncbi:MAG TPA: hypothetical protein VHW90_07065 [Stellaceae bacterium]|jgi:ElaB/YqjD/DUF883 family membrane-anchored ribosome-binding protein|nr:hypothetical protein [Stellaceae bacterium]
MDDQRMQDVDAGNKEPKRSSEPASSGSTGTTTGTTTGKSRSEQDRSALAGIVGDTMNQAGTMARNAGEQAWSAAANVGSQAQDLARRVREQTPDAVYEQSARASEYLTRNVNEYPLAALLIAGAVGYGIAYLVHTSWGSDDSATRAQRTANRTRGE